MALEFKTSNVSKEDFISKLFQSRDIAHIIHLQTKSYAQHKALNSYYDDILDMVDGLHESLQGKYGIIKLSIDKSVYIEPVKFFNDLANFIEFNKLKTFSDTWVLNQIDTVLELIYSTLYKLENLK